MNRQQITAYAAVVGAIFLIFYWTHMAFSSAALKAENSISSVQKQIEKASKLAADAETGTKINEMKSGLLSFLQTSAEKSGLAENLAGIKPKNVPGVKEASTIRLENINYNQAVIFFRTVERYGNISSASVRISKRFDDEQKLNLTMEILKK